VRQALKSATPPAVEVMARPRPALGQWLTTIDAILAGDRKAPRKQRHTARRIWQRLSAEHGAGVGEATVREYVRKRKRELYGVVEAMVPQVHEAGKEAEVDLYEAMIDFPSGREKVDFFEMRACHSGVAFHWPLRMTTQQAFLEAHVEAFWHFGGVFEFVRYDNLKQAVRKVLRGRSRLESESFTRLRSHYLYEADFCRPGEVGAHEKGGVEGEVGYFRRNHLVPVPKVADWGQLIEHCRQGSRLELARHLDRRERSIGEVWEEERSHLRRLPAEAFDTRLRMTARLDPKARAAVLRNRYSAPVGLCGLQVEAAVSTIEVVLSHGGREVGRHRRLYGTGGDSLQLDHYLEVLRYKPRAMVGSVPLHQAIAGGSFPSAYQEFFARLRERLGESEGARQMVDVLLLHRLYGAPVVFRAVEQTLDSGAYDYHAVAMLARELDAPVAVPVPAPQLRVLHCPQVPVPDCSEYDRLLAGVD